MNAIHKRRLLALAALLKKVPRERFNMHRWVGNSWTGDPTLSCGTSACALGWATTIPSLRRLGLRLSKKRYVVWKRKGRRTIPAYFDGFKEIASHFFGLTPEEADKLFMPHRGYNTPKVKAAQIIALVKSKG